MFVDLGAVRVLLRRHVVEFFKQRHVAVGIIVALDSGEAVPIPDTAEVSAHLDNPDVLDTGFLQVGGRQQSREASAENRDPNVR